MTREEDIVREITSFFKDLYSQQRSQYISFVGLDWKGIPNAFSAWLERPFTEEEVKELFLNVMGVRHRGRMDFRWQFFRRSGIQ